MRFLKTEGDLYFYAGPFMNKSLEIGVQRMSESEGFDFYLRFNTRGDHAGFKFFIDFWRFMFEFNITDVRHWNWEKKRWRVDDEYDSE